MPLLDAVFADLEQEEIAVARAVGVRFAEDVVAAIIGWHNRKRLLVSLSVPGLLPQHIPIEGQFYKEGISRIGRDVQVIGRADCKHVSIRGENDVEKCAETGTFELFNQ
jgi:hypothetical protein